MSGIFFNIIEINLVVSAIFLVVFLLSGRLRRRYGAGWLKLVWFLLALRLLIPYNFSLPDARIRLFTGISRTGTRQEASHVGDLEAAGRDFAGGESGTENGNAQYGGGVYGNGGGNAEGIAGTAGTINTAEKADSSETQMPGDGQEDMPGFLTDKGKAEEGEITESMAKPTGWAGRRREQDFEPFFNGNTLAWIWMAGVGGFTLLSMGSYLCFWISSRKNMLPVTDIGLKKRIAGIQRKLTGKAGIPVYRNRTVKSPMLAGLFLPKLILPAGRRDWTETELELVLAHELCHYKNKDLWCKLLMTAAWCVNWFNPFVWMLKKQFFYELELACDGSVLSGYDVKMREPYAQMMLTFAGEKGANSAFSTEFGQSKRQLKERIDYMLDGKTKKKGILSIAVVCGLLLTMGLMVSCGSGPQEEAGTEAEDAGQGETEDINGQNGEPGGPSREEPPEAEAESNGAQKIPYDPNNEYNEMIRCYGEDVFISRQDGIYRLSRDGEGEELLYANEYKLRRGMEIYQDFLYFCGFGQSQEVAIIYRMDLSTYEVEALASFSQMFGEADALSNLTIYDGKLYVAYGLGYQRIGFELDENGQIMAPLDREAEDFLFKEDNEYWDLQAKIWNNEVVFDSQEYWDTVNQMDDLYRNVIDTAACEKMLDGNQVVLKYKDELLTSVYLKTKEGNYEHLCDTISYPLLVTETGVYYFQDESFTMWYVDYETMTQEKIWEKDGRKRQEIHLVNYDRDYIYFTAVNQIGHDRENQNVFEPYLMRVPRWSGGEAEKVYRFETCQNGGSLYRNCAVVGERMFFNDYDTILLDPEVNGMGRENSGQPSEDAIAMRQLAEGFAEAYFQGDEEKLKAYLSEGYEGGMDLYPYPEQAEQVEELFISGLPDGELDVGVICFVSYEFSGNAETDGSLSYLSIEMEKTGQGWRVLSYGLEG